jgi:hypothetical protein
MNAIRQAMARRQGGGATPAINQVTSPLNATPGGGPNTPTTPPAPTPTPALPPGQAPLAVRGPQAPVAGGIKAPSNFDDETKALAKQLINKLTQAL